MTRARLSGHATDLGEARQRALEFAVAAGRVVHGGILAACLSAGCLMVFAFRALMPRWDLLLCCALLAVCRFVLAPAAWWAPRLDIGEAEAQRHAVARCRSHPVPLPEGSARAAAAPPLPTGFP